MVENKAFSLNFVFVVLFAILDSWNKNLLSESFCTDGTKGVSNVFGSTIYDYRAVHVCQEEALDRLHKYYFIKFYHILCEMNENMSIDWEYSQRTLSRVPGDLGQPCELRKQQPSIEDNMKI